MSTVTRNPAQKVYLALGTNIGDRQDNLQKALQALNPAVTIWAISSIYETEPVGYLEQPHFLNLVCAGETSLSPGDLLRFVKGIESALGRVPTFRNAPRPIDIDILLYADLQMQEETLTIPHPRMLERSFVLVPLAEIAPELIPPGHTQTVRALSERLSQQGIVKVSQYREGIQTPHQGMHQ
ncbi:MAG TPA: 2-amino-4-hydroxy-6-hydroxymethyldihydropteridine diphosphokinase [Ktedonobacteraceae bacterium]|jgi:2-amino-4-hydroxy-6-hydroxymethyldihydropteridine diphosphokinase|nr:2-amino-4-hydroxy-6-hydroxymethyldihydropteridine diphosphokinase [Ktedonobacteraceae bacterium]